MATFQQYILYASLVLLLAAASFALGMARQARMKVPWILIALSLVGISLVRLLTIAQAGGLPWAMLTDEEYRFITPFAALFTAALLFLALFAFRRVSAKERESNLARGDVERQLASLINNMPARVFIKDLSSRYVMVNQQFVEFARQKISDIIGKTDEELFPLTAADRASDDAIVFETQRPRVREETVTIDDVQYHFLTNKFPIFDSRGLLRGICGISTDVSPLKAAQAAAQQNERRLRLALDAAHMGIWEIDLETRQTTLSSGLAALLHLPPETTTITTAELDRTIERGDRGQLQRAMQAAIDSRQPFDCEFRTIAGSDGARWMSIKGHALYDATDQATRLLGTLTDITARKRLADELIESQYLNRRVLETTPDFVCVYDLQSGQFTYQNRSVRVLLGHSAEGPETDDALLRKAIHPVDAARLPDIARRLEEADEGQAVSSEVRLMHTDGRYHFVALRLTVFARGAGDRIRQVLVSAEDITPRRLAEAERDRIAALERTRSEQFIAVASASLAATASGLSVERVCKIITERARTIIGAHQAATSMSMDDGAAQAITAVDFSEKYADWKPAQSLSVRKALYAWVSTHGRAVRLEESAIAAHDDWSRDATAGDVPPLRGWLAAPLIGISGQTIGLIQLSDKFKGEFDAQDEAILVQLAAIAGSAIESARLLNESRRAKSEAESANQAKDRFLAVLSHELRTPLSPVLLSISSMEYDPSLSQEVRDDLAMARRNIELEVRLIDDLLDLSRIRSGKLRIAPQAVSLHDLVTLVTQICADDLRARRLEFDIRLDARHDTVMGDPARLQQVLWNLVKNAVKFSTEGGRVFVRTRETDGHIEVEVTDNGVGIDPATLPRLFDAFEQGQLTAKHQFGGLGLGLAISKAIVDIHQGRIDAFSKGIGQGATFTVRLPLASVPVRMPSERPVFGPVPAPLRMLLVEDHDDTSRLLIRLLAGAGYHVRAAASVDEAKSLLASETFDLLVSDIGLPDGTGYDLMRYVSAEYRLPGIAMSGYGMDDDLARSRDAGFGEHVVKPVEFPQLQSAIRRVTRTPDAVEA